MYKFLLGLFLFSISINGYSKSKVDWLLIYFIPYDNDLSYLGNSIVEKLKHGASSSTAVCVLADFDDANGIHRYSFNGKNSTKTVLSSEILSSSKTIRAYLNWIRHSFEAKHCAFFFLNHGGVLTDIGLDRTPTTNYCHIQTLEKEIELFNRKNRKIPDLLFLQVCAHGTIEAAYEFKSSARYTLYSQHVLGAPNSYYTGIMNELNQGTILNGKDLANKIITFDGRDLYSSYTLVNNDNMLRFSEVLEKSCKEMVADSSVDEGHLVSYTYFGEKYWDLKLLLNKWQQTTILSKQEAELLLTQFDSTFTYFPNSTSPISNQYRGVSIFSPYNASFKSYQALTFFSNPVYSKMLKCIKKQPENIPEIELKPIEFR
jgi:hypothetical protein